MMKKHTKAFLMSLFIFPGTGYLIVGQKTRAYVYMGLAATALAVLIAEIYTKTSAIAAKIQSGEIPNNPDVILNHIATMEGIFPPTLVTVLTYTLLFVWLFGSYDSYRLGKKDSETESL